VQIPTTEKDKQQEEQLAAVIPEISGDRTKSYPTYSTIMATQTQTRSVAAMGERNYSHSIKRSGPPDGDPPSGDPFRGFHDRRRQPGGGGRGNGNRRGDLDDLTDPDHHGRGRAANCSGMTRLRTRLEKIKGIEAEPSGTQDSNLARRQVTR
jgi:hypothetical protein